jgi:hypothetical protein
MKRIEAFIERGCPVCGAQNFGVYPKSVNTVGDGAVFMADLGDRDVVVFVREQAGVDGHFFSVDGISCFAAELNARTGAVLRKLLPFTAPVRVLGHDRTIGLGDRLGIATPGHIRAAEKFDALPVFAQQSMRELKLTGRDYTDVLDRVTFAVLREGYKRGFGADGDHLKTKEEIRHALNCGYTMITLDCSDYIRTGVGGMTDEQVAREYEADPDLESKYAEEAFLVNGCRIIIRRDEFMRIYLTYARAIDHVQSIHREFFADRRTQADLEISIDETDVSTTPAQHFFIARELRDRGIRVASLAPRFCGEFQKGIDYIGEISAFEEDFAVHAAIAEHFGYKISVHSGSDKFSVFPAVNRLTKGRWHVKTSGTSWLCAMQTVAACAPALYREIHAFALTVFNEAQTHYRVTPELSEIPDIGKSDDAQLPLLFGQNDVRQLIHITYGYILNAVNSDGSDRFRHAIFRELRRHRLDYEAALETHIGRHLSLLT